MDALWLSVGPAVNNLTSYAESIMHSLTSLMVLGTAVQSIFALPSRVIERDILRRDVDSFIATESPVALADLLCNIGADGACAAGAYPGITIASPDKTNPNCKTSEHCAPCHLVLLLT